MTTSLIDTKQALYLCFAKDEISQQPVDALTKCNTVYNYEPRPGDAMGPVYITVATFKGSPMEIEFMVRVYGKPDNPAQVQADMDVTIQEVWTILEDEANADFVVPSFECASHPQIDLLIATFKVQAGRADRQY